MAGYMYLGNKKVCPAIVVKQGTPYIPAYSIIDGEIVKPVYELTGHEFDGAEEIYLADEEWELAVFQRLGEGITGNLVFNDLRIVGEGGLLHSFEKTGIESVSFEKLNSVGYSGFFKAFSGCPNLKTAYFKGIENAMSDSFSWCFDESYLIEDIYFNSLKPNGSYTYAFRYLLDYTGTTKIHTIHFPSNLESVVQGLAGYPNFGGTSGYVVLAFDLPASE